MKKYSAKSERRTPEQIREHYEVEKELANRLRSASKQERLSLYSTLYDELYRRVPLHPQLTRKISPIERMRSVRLQMKFLKPFLNKNSIFLEIGPGDCALSIEASQFVKLLYAVDVSGEITKASSFPENFKLILSDGICIPVPTNSVDLAYSYNVMEHLHPDDAFEQLQEVYKVLVPGGVYLCITPNRLTGPHDVSKYFDSKATGFHLKEYTTRDLSILFKRVGFSRVRVYFGAKGNYVSLPTFLIAWLEICLDTMRSVVRKVIGKTIPLFMPDIRLLGMK
jgi:SAM-dependent methyltransferase